MTDWLKTHRYRLAVAALLIATGAMYSNVLHGPPIFDDIGYIKSNANIRDITDIHAIWHAWKHPARFVGYFTFALNYAIHGYNWLGFHVTNIGIHMVNILLVWSLVRLLFRCEQMRDDPLRPDAELVALITAMLFAAHPMQTQAVAYMAQRFASLATLFYLLSVWCYLQARLYPRRALPFFAAAGFSALLGMFTKQITITLPVAILLVEFLFVRPRGKGGRIDWRIVGGTGLFLLIVPAIFKFNAPAMLTIQHHSGSHRGDELYNMVYLMTQFRVICTYLSLMFLPVGQNLLYDFPASYSMLEPRTFWCFVLLVTIFAYGIRRVGSNRLLAFGIFWFFLTLSVESSVIVIKHVIFEHRMYLPSFGFFLCISAWLLKTFRSRRKCLAAATVIALTLAVLTYQRNFVWADDIAMWEDVIAKAPEKSRPHMNLGIAYVERSQWETAIHHLDTAIEKYGRNHAAYSNRGMAYFALGKPERAIQDFNRALEIMPDYQEALINRGNYYSYVKDYARAIADYDRVITLNPQAVEAIHNRANKYYQMKRYDRALEDYDRALALRPSFVRGYTSRGQVYSRLKKFELALDDFSRAIELDKENQSALFGRATTRFKKGDLHLALDDYNRLLELNPDHSKARALKRKLLSVLKQQSAVPSGP
ncbi:MAG: tetratricopeptide repeat protein [Candidatus Omnitrophica bacterium]|nr:tetratricopeptide repeat protein [Candidatus Omnitrophota bacterium]